MKIRLTTEDFIRRAVEKHGDRYDYSKSIYLGSKIKIKIICKKHGVFEQQPFNHISGQNCMTCSKSITRQEFIDKSKIVHKNKYDYSLVDYKESQLKVSIICPIHGVFYQKPNNHSQGQGCPECKDAPAWSVNSWAKSAKKSKNFDSFKVYIIKCWNNDEEFYKVGRTYTPIKYRFNNTKSMPYNYEVIYQFVFDNAKDCFDKETELKRLHIEYKYLPKISFGGMKECFNNIKSPILSSTGLVL